MSTLSTLLTKRLKKGENSSKMVDLALQSSQGNLSGFAGVFSIVDLNEKEKNALENILSRFIQDSQSIEKDLEILICLTSEIKAINNQAALLHGERIKRAQTVLKKYREGAFTAWLMAAYGNRQTPYNFLHYYDFYESLPSKLKKQVGEIPRQAVYTLASRQGPLELKHAIIENYSGETKAKLLDKIREALPLDSGDGRAENVAENLLRDLHRLTQSIKLKKSQFSSSQIKSISLLLHDLQTQLASK